MEAKNTTKPPIVVTMGDPAGVGPALVAEAVAQSKARALPEFVVFDAANRKNIKLEAQVVPGFPNLKNAKAITKSIELGVKAALSGKASAVVTCPINKESLIDAGFKHNGHTGFLGELTGAEPVMMLANDDLRVVPVTVHLPLREVPKTLTKKRIISTAKIVAHDLEKRFGIAKPRIALTGLNPHAGEAGKLGTEERLVIVPAIQEIQALDIHADGPFPADTAFTQAMRMKYDAFLAMTHDQALIPVKTLDFRKTVNITLGLPIIRTSPAHGTAFDLIREGRTPDPESFIQALIMADRLSS